MDNSTGNGNLTVGNNDANGTFNGVIQNTAGNVSLTKNGTGTQTLGGASTNTFTGLTTVNAGELDLNKPAGVDAIGSGGITVAGGTLKLLASDQINNAGSVAVNSGTFDLNGQSDTVNGLSGNGTILNNGGDGTSSTLTVGGNNGGGTYGGTLVDNNNSTTGTLALVKVGSGELILTNGGNSYSGGTTVAGGLLRATDNTIGSGNLTLQSGGIFFNVGTTGGGITPADTDFQKSVALGTGGGGFRAGWAAMTVSGQIGGTGSLTIVNDNVITLTNTGNNYDGDTIIGASGSGSNATLQLGASEVIPNGTGKGNVVFNATGGTATFNLNGNSETINALVSGGAGANVVNNSSATAVTLTLGDGDASGTYGGTLQNSGGALSLVKIGIGTQTLSGNSTYTGTTVVNDGTLLVDGSIAGPAVVSGGTLGGIGTVGGQVTVNTGSLAPGNSPGILTVNSSVEFTGGSFDVELWGLTVGTEYDQLEVTGGDVILGDGLAALAVTTGGGYVTDFNHSFWIINNSSDPTTSTSGYFQGLQGEGSSLLIDGQRFYIYYHADLDTGSFFNGNDVLLTSVPEPSTLAMLLGLGGVGLLGYLRRRKS